MTVKIGSNPPNSGQITDFKTTFEIMGSINPSYTGTLTGGTGVINIGSGQFVKDASGNIGIGTTPSAWVSGYRGLDIGTTLGLVSRSDTAGVDTSFATNSYRDQSGNWVYKFNGEALKYSQTGSGHSWFIAPSGTAGNPTSFKQAMTLDASGNLGIGAPSQGKKLEVWSGNTQTDILAGSTNTAYGTVLRWDNAVGAGNLFTNANYPLLFGTNSTERACIDTSGNLGLGVTPSAWSGYTALQVGSQMNLAYSNGVSLFGTNNYWNGSAFIYKDTGYFASQYYQYNGTHVWNTSPSGTAGNPISFTQAMTLDASGRLQLGAATADAFDMARFSGTDATANDLSLHGPSTSQVRLQFSRTGANGRGEIGYNMATDVMRFVVTGSERARIDAAGNLLVGCSSVPSSTVDGSAFEATGVGNQRKLKLSTYSTSVIGLIEFFNPNGSVGYISTSGSTTTYATSSDARLKENIAAADNGSALIDSLQVRQFDWKSDGSHQRYGFIAQELDAVYPEAVSKPADPDEMMGVDYSKLVPLLVQEIQSLRARVAALEIV